MEAPTYQLQPDKPLSTGPSQITQANDQPQDEHIRRLLAAFREFLAAKVAGRLQDLQEGQGDTAKTATLGLGGMMAAPLPFLGILGVAAPLGRAIQSNIRRQEELNRQAVEIEIHEQKEILINDVKESIIEDNSDSDIEYFISYYKRRHPNLIEELTDKDQPSVGRRFAKFLSERGIKAPEIEGHLDEFVRTEMPELAVLSAVRELREIHKNEQPTIKFPYPGRKAEPDGIAYLLKHYGAEIAAGELSAGQLQTIDQKLYTAVRAQLSEADEQMTVSQFFERETGQRRANKVERKALSFATILGASVDEAARFLSGVRPDRVRWVSRTGHQRANIKM